MSKLNTTTVGTSDEIIPGIRYKFTDETTCCRFCNKQLRVREFIHPKDGHTFTHPEFCGCEGSKIAFEADSDKRLYAAMQEIAERRKSDIIAKVTFANGVPNLYKSYRLMHFETSDDNKITQTNKQSAYDKTGRIISMIIDAYKQDVPAKGATFYGSVGTGKTMLATIICNEVSREGVPNLFTNFGNIIDDLKDTFNTHRSEEDAFRRYKEVYLLVLDDISKEQATEYSLSKLFSLVDYRQSMGFPTVITANHDPMYLIKVLTPRGTEDKTKAEAIVDRIRSMSEHIIPMQWESRRN